MSRKTHTNPFSKREIEILRMNPFVKSVTVNSISFTEEFKELAYEEKSKGMTMPEIMRKNGIDPEMLGRKRIENFSYLLKKKVMQSRGFTDQRRENYHRPAKTGEETVDQRIQQLEHELAYTRQEVEFLKKLQAANMEAQRQWESKHRRK